MKRDVLIIFNDKDQKELEIIQEVLKNDDKHEISTIVYPPSINLKAILGQFKYVIILFSPELKKLENFKLLSESIKTLNKSAKRRVLILDLVGSSLPRDYQSLKTVAIKNPDENWSEEQKKNIRSGFQDLLSSKWENSKWEKIKTVIWRILFLILIGTTIYCIEFLVSPKKGLNFSLETWVDEFSYELIKDEALFHSETSIQTNFSLFEKIIISADTLDSLFVRQHATNKDEQKIELRDTLSLQAINQFSKSIFYQAPLLELRVDSGSIIHTKLGSNPDNYTSINHHISNSPNVYGRLYFPDTLIFESWKTLNVTNQYKWKEEWTTARLVKKSNQQEIVFWGDKGELRMHQVYRDSFWIKENDILVNHISFNKPLKGTGEWTSSILKGQLKIEGLVADTFKIIKLQNSDFVELIDPEKMWIKELLVDSGKIKLYIKGKVDLITLGFDRTHMNRINPSNLSWFWHFNKKLVFGLSLFLCLLIISIFKRAVNKEKRDAIIHFIKQMPGQLFDLIS